MRLWAIAFLVAACGQDPPDGHQRMLDLLVKVRDDTAETNIWLGDKRARDLRAWLEKFGNSSSPAMILRIHAELGYAEMILGNARASVEHLGQAMRIWEAMDARKLPSGGILARNEILFQLGVAYLRLGVTQNCCQMSMPNSCVLPILADAVHGKKEGSSGAIQAFGEIMRTTPQDSALYRRSLWLLNIAHMYLGLYPESVLPEHRLPPSAFESTRRRTTAPSCRAVHESRLPSWSLSSSSLTT